MSSASESAGLLPNDPLQKETYVSLIRRAIGEPPDAALTLNDLYDVMLRKHPDIALNRPGWKNTTRHCLSMNPCFVNRSKPFPLPGRGGYWTVDVNAPNSYSRNRSRSKRVRSKSSSVSPTPLSSSLPSHKRTRRKSGLGHASASSSRANGTLWTTGPDEVPKNVGSLSYPGLSGEGWDVEDDGRSPSGLDEGSEEFDEGERRSDPQLLPWTQPQPQHRQYRSPPPGPFYPSPHQVNYTPYHMSYNHNHNNQGSTDNFPPPIQPDIFNPSSSSHHFHPFPPIQLNPQRQKQLQQSPFKPFLEPTYSPCLWNQNPIHHPVPQQLPLPPFLPRREHSSYALAKLVDFGKGSSSTSKEVPDG